MRYDVGGQWNSSRPMRVSMLRRLWTWISQENNRQTLAWLGGAVVVIVGAAWKVYTYESPRSASAPAQTAVSGPAASKVPADGISADDDGAIQVAGSDAAASERAPGELPPSAAASVDQANTGEASAAGSSAAPAGPDQASAASPSAALASPDQASAASSSATPASPRQAGTTSSGATPASQAAANLTEESPRSAATPLAAPGEAPRSQSAIARDGGIAINADGEASVSVQQSRP